MILGETGVGKSTWINGIVNYMAYPSLKQAMDTGSMLVIIPFKWVSWSALNCLKTQSNIYDRAYCENSFFSIWVFFHKHSRFTGLQGKEEANSVTAFCYLHSFRGDLDINRAITIESSPLSIVGSRPRMGNLWFLRASR